MESRKHFKRLWANMHQGRSKGPWQCSQNSDEEAKQTCKDSVLISASEEDRRGKRKLLFCVD